MDDDGTNATCDKLITYKFNLRKCEVKFNGASEPIRNSDIKPHSNPQPMSLSLTTTTIIIHNFGRNSTICQQFDIRAVTRTIGFSQSIQVLLHLSFGCWPDCRGNGRGPHDPLMNGCVVFWMTSVKCVGAVTTPPFESIIIFLGPSIFIFFPNSFHPGKKYASSSWVSQYKYNVFTTNTNCL